MPQNKKPIDIRKIKTLIKSGLQALPFDKYHQEAVVVLGDTGVGKSTLLSLLSGSKMIAKFDGIKVSLHTQTNSRAKVGHTKLSETFIPMKILASHIAFYDCPGFNDNQGEQFEMANSFFLQRLLDIYRKVKIIIMVEEDHISQVRADRLPRLLHNLLAFFGSFQDIADGCCLVISRADPQNSVNEYIGEINKMIQNERMVKFFNDQQTKLLKFLVDNDRILLFQEPKKRLQEYQYFMGEQQLKIMPKIKQISSVRSKHIKNNCSQSCKLSIRKLIDQIIDKSKNKLRTSFSAITHEITQSILLKENHLETMIQLKQRIQKIKMMVKNNKGKKFLQIFQSIRQTKQVKQIQEGIATIQFFKDIYDKEEYYYQNIQNILLEESNEVFRKIQKQLSEKIRYLNAKISKQKEETTLKIESNEQQIKKMKNDYKSEVQNYISTLQNQTNKKAVEYDKKKLLNIENQKNLDLLYQQKVQAKIRENQQKKTKKIQMLEEKKLHQKQIIEDRNNFQNAKNLQKLKSVESKNVEIEQKIELTQKIAAKIKQRNQQWMQKQKGNYKEEEDIPYSKIMKIENVKSENQEKIQIKFEQQNSEISYLVSAVPLQKMEKQEFQPVMDTFNDLNQIKNEQNKIEKDNLTELQSIEIAYKIKSFQEKKAQILNESLRAEEQLSSFINNIKKRRQLELEKNQQAEKQVLNSIYGKRNFDSKIDINIKKKNSDSSFENLNRSLRRQSINSNLEQFNRNQAHRLRESAPTFSYNGFKNRVQEPIQSKYERTSSKEPIIFQKMNLKKQFAVLQQKFVSAISLTQRISNQKEQKFQKQDNKDERKERIQNQKNLKSRLPASSLISQINDVLLNLNNISGDLQKAKLTVSKLSNKIAHDKFESNLPQSQVLNFPHLSKA